MPPSRANPTLYISTSRHVYVCTCVCTLGTRDLHRQTSRDNCAYVIAEALVSLAAASTLELVLILYAGTKQAITTARRDERSAQNESGGENAFYAFYAVYLSHSHLLSISS